MSDVVSTSATTDPITLADVKRHLNVSTTADDQLIGDYITSAVSMLSNRTNRAWITETRTLKMHRFDDPRYAHDRAIYPPVSPVGSVTSITYVDSAGTTQTLSTTAYLVSTADQPGRISEAYNNTWPVTRVHADAVTVTYTAGYGSTQSAVPANAKHAIRLLCGHWYRNREAVGTVGKEIEQGIDALLIGEEFPQYG